MKAALWVFGYGSLIWHPEFPVAERHVARLAGWHRSFCMRSIHHRGSVEAPGLVLALDRATGVHCDGVAFRVAEGAEDETLAALRERELISSAYIEEWLDVTLSDGRQVTALAYVIDPVHEQYCGGLPLEEQAEIIAHATGGRGPNRDYLYSTAEHLAALGIADADLDWLAARVRQLCS
ncbi:gamma-glutamylcyclotransferase [Paragemmobacter straminiformis]|uniref:glutathione-specific gamma-glutamylcyclotransferase n=1 Tax=Paragemmobacter straminiformis TaxID=2045119 RepID=A0A842I684_9RHOB|nr:gamma-glutamylcyclotransferase [Gemmobacter straminiformis]MBC2834887.1 gamma-glutamylcyclotransferase [Gemmobacter straminiformis]